MPEQLQPGDYAVRGSGQVSGICAACERWIAAGEAFEIKDGRIYHPAGSPSCERDALRADLGSLVEGPAIDPALAELFDSGARLKDMIRDHLAAGGMIGVDLGELVEDGDDER